MLHLRQTLTFVSCVLLLLAACPVAAATHVVRVGNYWFSPINIAVALGDSVRWTNVSLTVHDTTHTPSSGTRLWSADLNVSSQKTYTFTFTNAGYYPYACIQHINLMQTGGVFAVAARIESVERLPDGRTQVTIVGGRQGLRAVTEVSTNPTVWTPISTNSFPLSGTITVTDAAAATSPASFYRVRVFLP